MFSFDAGKLSETKQLRGGVVFLDALPYTPAGKVARGKLRQLVMDARREWVNNYVIWEKWVTNSNVCVRCIGLWNIETETPGERIETMYHIICSVFKYFISKDLRDYLLLFYLSSPRIWFNISENLLKWNYLLVLRIWACLHNIQQFYTGLTWLVAAIAWRSDS